MGRFVYLQKSYRWRFRTESRGATIGSITIPALVQYYHHKICYTIYMSHLIQSTDIHGQNYKVAIEKLAWRPACYAIVIHEGKILLTKQHGTFHLPGGGLNLGEMPEDGVIREVKEETGLLVTQPKIVDMISGFFTLSSETPNHVQSILLYFQCELIGGTLSTDGFEEDEKLIGEMPVWVPLETLDAIPAGSTVDWRSVVKKHLLPFQS